MSLQIQILQCQFRNYFVLIHDACNNKSHKKWAIIVLNVKIANVRREPSGDSLFVKYAIFLNSQYTTLRHVKTVSSSLYVIVYFIEICKFVIRGTQVNWMRVCDDSKTLTRDKAMDEMKWKAVKFAIAEDININQIST